MHAPLDGLYKGRIRFSYFSVKAVLYAPTRGFGSLFLTACHLLDLCTPVCSLHAQTSDHIRVSKMTF